MGIKFYKILPKMLIIIRTVVRVFIVIGLDLSEDQQMQISIKLPFQLMALEEVLRLIRVRKRQTLIEGN
jgi:hypothetical protein